MQTQLVTFSYWPVPFATSINHRVVYLSAPVHRLFASFVLTDDSVNGNSQSLAAKARGALWTGTGIVWTAGSSMLTRGYAGSGHSYRPRKEKHQKKKAKRSESCTSMSGTLTRFTGLARKSFRTATPVEANAHAAIAAEFLTLNWLCGNQM